MRAISLAIGLFFHIGAAATVDFQKIAIPPECEQPLQVLIEEDPFSLKEMRQARATAKRMGSLLSDWNYKADELNSTRVNKTLKNMRQEDFDLDGEGFRNLFLVTERFLLASKGAQGRIRPLSEVLQVTEGEGRLLVNFIAQLDVLASQNEMNRDWPAFLRLSVHPHEFFQAELGSKIPSVLKSYLINTFANVLGDRLRYSRLSVNSSANQLKVRSPVGIYFLNFHRGKVLRLSIAPVHVRSTDTWGRQNDRLIYSQVDLAVEDMEARSFLRTMVRADAFFHPHLIPPTFELYPQPAKMSEVQEEGLKRLLKLDKSVSEAVDDRPVELGLVMPTGEGKTVVVAEYIKHLTQNLWNGQKPRIVLVVENVQILQQTVESFQRDLGLKADKISMLFGESGEIEINNGVFTSTVQRGSSLSPPVDFELVVVTRTTLYQRLSSLEHWILREKGQRGPLRHPFAIIVDEAHHIGTEYGQFEAILNLMRQRLDAKDRIVMLSATLWHPDKKIITDVLNGHVTATHLLEDELKKLQAGQDLERLARTQFLRATVDGYVGPIDDRSFSLEDKKWKGQDIANLLKVHKVADQDLYTHVSHLIRAMRTSGIMDRYVFFEVRQERAEEGADYLMSDLGGAAGKISDLFRASWFLHSQLSSDEQNRRMEWFRDRGDFRGSRNIHKYLTTVGQLLEGVDIRGINGIVIMRNLASNRLAQQVLGRGARLEPFKTGVRLIDVPGKIINYLEEAGELWSLGRFRKLDTAGFGKPPSEPLTDRTEDRELDLSWRPIKMEPALRKERSLLLAWKDVTPEEIVAFHSPNGASQLLGYDSDRAQFGSTVKLHSWFMHWIAAFPEEVRTLWKTQWELVKLSDDEIPISSLAGDNEVQALRAFHLLSKMFNGMSKQERMGFAQIPDEDRYLRSGQAKIMAALDPNFNFLLLGGLRLNSASVMTFSQLSESERQDLIRAVDSGDLFSGEIPADIAASFKRRGPRTSADVLSTIEALLSARPALNTPEARRIFRAAHRYSKYRNQGLISAYYLGLLMNHYMSAANLSMHKPWNLNGHYGAVAGKDFIFDEFMSEPNEFEVWSTLDLVDYQLRKIRRGN